MIRKLIENVQGIGAKDRQHVCDLNAGTLFGELAILYNCRRTATITSKTDIEVRVTTIKLKNASK